MPWNDVLVVCMFVAFIGLIFTGFPVAWVLGGLALAKINGFDVVARVAALWASGAE